MSPPISADQIVLIKNDIIPGMLAEVGQQNKHNRYFNRRKLFNCNGPIKHGAAVITQWQWRNQMRGRGHDPPPQSRKEIRMVGNGRPHQHYTVLLSPNVRLGLDVLNRVNNNNNNKNNNNIIILMSK